MLREDTAAEPAPRARRRVLILGAAGRDFHNFNVVFRDDPFYEVVAFTSAQIPGVGDRHYPSSLSGALYPRGIPILREEELEACVRTHGVDLVVLAYSDLSHQEVMHRASRALAAGPDFALLGPKRTMLAAPRPVIAVSAVRTGAGKSPAARWIAARLHAHGLRVAVIRHPMPYGNLGHAAVQRFASRADLDAAHCSLEEREEYEPHLAAGSVVYAGIDYARVLARASEEADFILWDGGNNDFPFVRPDLHVVLADALRPGHESAYHPGEACLRMADVVVVSKAAAAPPESVDAVEREARRLNPRAPIVRAALEIALPQAETVRGKRVLVVEDGPTITHGGLPHGAGYAAALRAGAGTIVDPRSGAGAEILEIYAQYPHIGPVLPAMGYTLAQRRALKRTIDAAKADVVIAATPADLASLLGLDTPVLRVRYEFAPLGSPGLGELLDEFLASRAAGDAT